VRAYRHDIIDLSDPIKSQVAHTVIDGWMKLIVPGPEKLPENRRKFEKLADEIELFDLKNDPGERINLAEKIPEQVKRLKTLSEGSAKKD
jgi:hypothetical protein